MKTKKDIETLSKVCISQQALANTVLIVCLMKDVVTSVLKCINDLKGVDCDRNESDFAAIYRSHCEAVAEKLNAMAEYFGRTQKKVFMQPDSLIVRPASDDGGPAQPQPHASLMETLKEGSGVKDKRLDLFHAAHADSVKLRREQNEKEKKAHMLQLEREKLEQRKKELAERERRVREMMGTKANAGEVPQSPTRVGLTEWRRIPGSDQGAEAPAGGEPAESPTHEVRKSIPRFCGECGGPFHVEDGAIACDICGTPYGFVGEIEAQVS